MTASEEIDDPPAPSAPTEEVKLIEISREELSSLPVRRYEGPVHLVQHNAQVAAACEALKNETLLGFDIETRPSFRVGESHPPALIQLAGENAVFVFQLLRLTGVAPLLDLLAAPNVKKAGVAIADDLKKLRAAYSFTPAGFVEIGTIARDSGYKQTGLRALCGLLMGFRMSKGEQRSNWAAQVLTPRQITYAATDAWASRELYLRLSAPR